MHLCGRFSDSIATANMLLALLILFLMFNSYGGYTQKTNTKPTKHTHTHTHTHNCLVSFLLLLLLLCELNTGNTRWHCCLKLYEHWSNNNNNNNCSGKINYASLYTCTYIYINTHNNRKINSRHTCNNVIFTNTNMYRR